MQRFTFLFVTLGLAAATSLSFVAVGCGSSTEMPCTPGSCKMGLRCVNGKCVEFDPFKTVPECGPDKVLIKPLMGDRQVLISKLEIAPFNEGFDMTGDGKIDNKLAPLGSLANPAIVEAFKFQQAVVIPIEFYGYTGSDSECTKFAFYLGRYIEDRDKDGRDTTWENGKADCDDTNPMVKPKQKEDLTNRMDDDCDGFADNMSVGTPPNDNADQDGDGVTLRDGDCDDRKGVPAAKMRNPKAKDVCGNGIDENCNGLPDDDPSCDPYAENKVAVHVQQLSFEEGTMKPIIVFPNGTVKAGALNAGPNLFKLNIPFQDDIKLDLTLTGAKVKAGITDKSNGTYVDKGVLAGVLQANSLAQIHIDAGGVLKKEQSLLDGIFVGPAAAILGLDSDKDQHYLPDVDVDGDGFETFWQENMLPDPDGGAPIARIDTCRDGDGTVIKGLDCPLAKDAKGNYRFVDGLSVALRFWAVPVTIKDVVPK